MSNEAIVVEDLVKKYGDLTAVNGISFKVRKGEVFGFLGPNGAGKTTTIHILTTLLKPTSGDAYVGGYHVVKEARKVRESIGVVFQDPSLDDQLTAYENMYLHGRIYGMSGEDLKRRVDSLLEFVDLKEFRNKQVKTFSGGMRRRLEIARALVHKPKILFLDEPTLGLDPQTRANIWDYIQELRKTEGTTIFLTTHYMDEAEILADRLAIIDHGKIVAEGTPESLKKIVGNEVVYVRLGNNNNELEPKCIDASFIKDCKMIPPDQLVLKVESASEALPKIFEIISSKGFTIKEINYKRPNLNDVFLYLTGREIRDREGNRFDVIRQIIRRR